MYANPAFKEILGYTPEEMMHSRAIELIHPEDRPKAVAAIEALLKGGPQKPMPPAVFRIQHRNRSWRYLSILGCNLSNNQAVAGLLLSGRDITEQYQRQHANIREKKRQLHYLNRLFQMAQYRHTSFIRSLRPILEASANVAGIDRCSYWKMNEDQSEVVCVMMYDNSERKFRSDAAHMAFPIDVHPLLQQALQESKTIIVSDVDRDTRADSMRGYLHSQSIKAMVLAPAKKGSNVEGILCAVHLHHVRHWSKDESDFIVNVSTLISLFYKEAERARTEDELRHLAHHDSLTGLPNRHYLQYHTTDIFPKIAATSPSLAAFFIDLDGFKSINDSLGHAIGDELLKAVARRLKNSVRKNDILVRLGGDEFMLLARELTRPHIAEDIAKKIVESMRETFSLNGRELHISASVGISFYPFDGTDLETLMKKADIAMYHAKSAGRDQYHLFAPVLMNGASDRLKLEIDLRHALERNQLEFYYQAQIDLASGEVRCVEAFLRWLHPQRGLLLPSHFMPVAEESGLITDVSQWMFDHICLQWRLWRDRGLDGLNMAINLSTSQLMDQAIVPLLEATLERTGVPASRLEWEVKEGAVMQHNTTAAAVLDSITQMQIPLAIDDFGTGYSSLSYLRRYSVKKLKIDRSLVAGLPAEGDDCAITDAIISMAHPLGLVVVAEGVETPQQLEYLRTHGCDLAQGYYFSQPLSLGQFETWLTRR